MTVSRQIFPVLALLLAIAVPAFAQRARTERFQNREVVSQEIIVRFRGAASAEARSQSIRSEDTDITASSPAPSACVREDATLLPLFRLIRAVEMLNTLNRTMCGMRPTFPMTRSSATSGHFKTRGR